MLQLSLIIYRKETLMIESRMAGDNGHGDKAHGLQLYRGALNTAPATV